jgi:histidinol-phosphate aminotransferase
MGYFRATIERMAGYTPGFQPREGGFVKLNTNENPYPPSPRVIAAMREACGEAIRKYPPPLADALRDQAARLLGVRPECILAGYGSDDVLTIAVRSFCGEGDVLACPYPTYSLYPLLAQIQGARCVEVDFPEDFSLPEGLARADARLVLMANPNAPSGTMIPQQDMARLARSITGVLLIDEAYVDFADWNCVELTRTCPNVIVTRTLSKSYSLAGLRVGYAVANEALIEGMIKVKDSYNLSLPAVAGGAAALADQDWLRRTVDRIRATRARLVQGLRGLGFTCWPSQANFVLARVPAGRDAQAVYDALFERKILVRYWAGRRLDDCLRITVGTDEETQALLSALREVLNA